VTFHIATVCEINSEVEFDSELRARVWLIHGDFLLDEILRMQCIHRPRV
jgi:hypothetical protein